MITPNDNNQPDKNNINTKIFQLFVNSSKIRIPSYQRAYSWEEKQCSQFLDDLLEQRSRQYYLGQILFEKDGDTLFIIDGQQRLTTTIIFISAIIKILNTRGHNTEEIRKIYLTNIFKTIDDDQVVFKRVTQKHHTLMIENTETISQRRIIKSFTFFEEKLAKLDNERLKEIQNTLENSSVSTFYITNKIEATQIFEYQNNRGKELSRFEIIKAYLMHQIYVQNNNNIQANDDIAEIQIIISKTYKYIEAVEGYFTENELLDNYCNLFFGITATIETIKERLNKETNKPQWINLFFEDFMEITYSAKSVIINKNQSEITNLFFVGNEVNWKLVLLTIFHKGEASGAIFKRILKLLEILCFKLKLGDYRTDYLPSYAKQYFSTKNDYDIKKLYEDIKKATEIGFKEYWNNGDAFKKIIINYYDVEKHHYNRNTIKFVLWQYENSLRLKSGAGVLLDKDLYDIYTIEHIEPQTPKGEGHTDEFKKNFLHLAGNLALLTREQNSKFGNRPFSEKKALFNDTALSSYTEIRKKPKCEGHEGTERDKWEKDEIIERHIIISEFVKQYFDINEQMKKYPID